MLCFGYPPSPSSSHTLPEARSLFNVAAVAAAQITLSLLSQWTVHLRFTHLSALEESGGVRDRPRVVVVLSGIKLENSGESRRCLTIYNEMRSSGWMFGASVCSLPASPCSVICFDVLFTPLIVKSCLRVGFLHKSAKKSEVSVKEIHKCRTDFKTRLCRKPILSVVACLALTFLSALLAFGLLLLHFIPNNQIWHNSKWQAELAFL